MIDSSDGENNRCKTCNSPSPDRHPAMQHEGEVEICGDPFHWRLTPQNGTEYIAESRAKAARP